MLNKHLSFILTHFFCIFYSYFIKEFESNVSTWHFIILHQNPITNVSLSIFNSYSKQSVFSLAYLLNVKRYLITFKLHIKTPDWKFTNGGKMGRWRSSCSPHRSTQILHMGMGESGLSASSEKGGGEFWEVRTITTLFKENKTVLRGNCFHKTVCTKVTTS